MHGKAALVAAALGLLATPAAHGATTLGKLPARLSDYQAFQCVGGTYAQTGTALTSPSYRVPANGVITSWRNSAGVAGEVQERLKIVRPSAVAPDVFRIIGASAYATPVPFGSPPLPTRITVRAGDLIALGVHKPDPALVDHMPACIFGPAAAGDVFRQRTVVSLLDEDPDPELDRLWNMTVSPVLGNPNSLLAVSAVFELDADGDGFGDDTQDACAGVAGPNNGCLPDFPKAPPDLPPPDTSAPVVSGYGLSARTFRVGTKATALTGVAAKAKAAPKLPTGTTLRFTLSEPATVVIDLQQALAGRRSRGRCVAPTASLRKAAHCSRSISRGRLTRTSHAAANAVAFSGRLGSRPLGAGGYRAVLIATDAAGNASKPQTASFTVVRR